jgi:hypothetical protein
MDNMTQDINMMQPVKVHLTQEGYDEIKEELDKLRTREPAAVERVTKARSLAILPKIANTMPPVKI